MLVRKVRKVYKVHKVLALVYILFSIIPAFKQQNHPAAAGQF
jgi:hypothetical protein